MTEIRKGDLITNKTTGQQVKVDKVVNDGIGPLYRGNTIANKKVVHEGYLAKEDSKLFAPQPPKRKDA